MKTCYFFKDNEVAYSKIYLTSNNLLEGFLQLNFHYKSFSIFYLLLKIQ